MVVMVLLILVSLTLVDRINWSLQVAVAIQPASQVGRPSCLLRDLPERSPARQPTAFFFLSLSSCDQPDALLYADLESS